jgi:hypothetical protein
VARAALQDAGPIRGGDLVQPGNRADGVDVGVGGEAVGRVASIVEMIGQPDCDLYAIG